MFKKIENFFPVSFAALFTSLKGEEVVRSIIEEKIPSGEFEIKLKNKKLFIFTSNPGAKSELFLRRGEILKELKNRLGYSLAESVAIQKFE